MPWQGQAGVTAIETTIIMVAFVTLATVFGFAVLTTGILTAEESKGAVITGLEQTEANFLRRGPVVGISNEEVTAIDFVVFELASPARGTEGGYVSGDAMIITYIDADQVMHLGEDSWTAQWLIGFGPLLNPGERVEMRIDLRNLDPRLGPARKFSIQLSPDRGASLLIEKTTPKELAELVDLP